MESTLVLNASFEPLNIISARKAVLHILNGKAIAVDNSPKFFRSETSEVAIPYVVQLTTMVQRKHRGKLGFSRRAVLLRDNFLCVYCGKKATTIDHVFPRSKGGENSYENCVAACTKCNHKKADVTLKALGWNLGFSPKAPSPYILLMQGATTNSEQWNSWNQFVEPWSEVVFS